MLRIPRPLAIAIAALPMLCACNQATTEDPETLAPVTNRAADAAIQPSGREAYDQVCARCHENGVDGAPKTGDREAWTNRSFLWEAVLFEHAKAGYMDMPARGGDELLDDATVEKAAEYMLSRTFPNMKRSD